MATGVFIAIDHLILQIERDSMVDVYGIVTDMQMHRPLMVQTEVSDYRGILQDQYKLSSQNIFCGHQHYAIVFTIDRSQRPALLSYCCYPQQTMSPSHHTSCSHAVKNTLQSK